MPLKNPQAYAIKACATLSNDRNSRLLRIDNYERGIQDPPFRPDTAEAEFDVIAARSVTNVIPFVLGTPAQLLKVDRFRRGRTSSQEEASLDAVQPEWDHWQRSRMDARQQAIHRGALKFGHSFVHTYREDGKVLSKGLSALKTVALYEDPANDDDPLCALHVNRWPDGERPGLATLWDDTYEYVVVFTSLTDEDSITVKAGVRHGASVCPITRFAAAVDLEGRTCGVVEPMFVLQDRINQTVFDLLIVQSFASFKVKTIAGLAPPVLMKAVDEDGNTVDNPEGNPDLVDHWVPVIDPATGRPVPDPVRLNAMRVLWAEDEDTKFGTLDETPLDGFIKAIELGFRHMAALSQTPPHHILGEISNLSAEALNAAETALARKVDEFKTAFGESWERVFRIAAEIGEYEGADDWAGEVIWRDMGNASMSQTADALGKLADQLGIPKRGLWSRVPGVGANELAEWNDLYKQERPEIAMSDSATGAGTATARPSFRLASNQPDSAGSQAA